MIAAGLLVCLPDVALAWGPATHVQAGVDILRSLDLLPTHIAGLLAQYPIDFLYGNLAADISMAKKYAPVGRHCHHWHVAREMYEAAGDDERLQAALLGYQCHLAADVLAHNSFVPRMLLLTSSTRALGHSYWEHRMDADVGSAYSHLARWIVTRYDHSHTDALFRRLLSSTLFTFSTNRRIFRGMIRINGNESWQAIFDTVVDNSRWDLDPTTVVRYQRHTFDLVADFLIRETEARAAAHDPIGEESLGEAKRVRRRAMMAGGWRSGEAILATADHHFPLPAGRTELWDRRGATSAEASKMIADSMNTAGDPGLTEIAEWLSSGGSDRT
ncbi:MAG: zinc dependent phospholipase C family protein [Gemmatimonadota bacterium]|nr:zinc dependent phospholipase C family protein [Gemmatimonadota bacterium]